jgi:hypothetical protein
MDHRLEKDGTITHEPREEQQRFIQAKGLSGFLRPIFQWFARGGQDGMWSWRDQRAAYLINSYPSFRLQSSAFPLTTGIPLGSCYDELVNTFFYSDNLKNTRRETNPVPNDSCSLQPGHKSLPVDDRPAQHVSHPKPILTGMTVRGNQETPDAPIELSLKVEVQLKNTTIERASEAAVVGRIERSYQSVFRFIQTKLTLRARCSPLVTVLPLLVHDTERNVFVRWTGGEDE